MGDLDEVGPNVANSRKTLWPWAGQAEAEPSASASRGRFSYCELPEWRSRATRSISTSPVMTSVDERSCDADHQHHRIRTLLRVLGREVLRLPSACPPEIIPNLGPRSLGRKMERPCQRRSHCLAACHNKLANPRLTRIAWDEAGFSRAHPFCGSAAGFGSRAS